MLDNAVVHLFERLSCACRRFLRNDQGNIALMAAFVVPLAFGAISLGIDYNNVVTARAELQRDIDSATLAAAASINSGHHSMTDISDYTKNFLLAQMANSLTADEKTALAAALLVEPEKKVVGSKTTYTVKLRGSYRVRLSGFASFIGYTSIPIAAVSTAVSEAVAKNALSMYIVLDRSGSMSFVTETVKSAVTKCQNYTASNWSQYPNLATSKPCYINKIAALKTAAASLFDVLDQQEAIDSSDSIIRTGGVSFTDSMQTANALAWGTTSMRSYVTALPAYPTGGTDMTGGMDAAYKALIASSETTAQANKSNTTFQKFIVLMTDGENTGASTKWNPGLDTKTLATCKAARDSGITIFTVAFMAPTNGKALLLSCAGVSGNAFVADDMKSLVAAFASIGAKASKQMTRITN
jgi:Flp pilus assembly protein TadG